MNEMMFWGGVVYLCAGAVVLALNWHRSASDPDIQLRDRMAAIARVARPVPAEALATGIGTGLAVLVGLFVWPLTLMSRRTQAADRARRSLQRVPANTQTPRILRQPPPDDDDS